MVEAPNPLWIDPPKMLKRVIVLRGVEGEGEYVQMAVDKHGLVGFKPGDLVLVFSCAT